MQLVCTLNPSLVTGIMILGTIKLNALLCYQYLGQLYTPETLRCLSGTVSTTKREDVKLRETGFVSSRICSASSGEGPSLVLIGHPSSAVV